MIWKADTNRKRLYLAFTVLLILIVIISVTNAYFKGRHAMMPAGYELLFEDDFTNTTIDPTIDGNQWWYRFKGTDPNWNNMAEIDRVQKRPARVQTLIGREKRNPMDYIYAEVVDRGEDRGRVLKTTVIEDDPDFQAISRFQALFQFDDDFNKLFHTFSFNIPADMKDHLVPNRVANQQSDWVLITEFHSIGPGQNRLGLYILNTEEHGVHYSLQLRDEDNKTNLFRDFVAPYDEWDQWVDVAMQIETEGTGPEDGLIRLWLNGEKVYERADSYIGFPLRRLMTLKNYVGRGSMPFTIYWDDVKIYRKD